MQAHAPKPIGVYQLRCVVSTKRFSCVCAYRRHASRRCPLLRAFFVSSCLRGCIFESINGSVSQRSLPIASSCRSLYGECMARLISTTVRLHEDDVRALKRARAAGHSASDLVRKGLRVVASRYYTGRRPPSTRLFESTDTKLGDESELFRELDG